MKILVTYFSQTGNTKKIAEAIYSAIPDSCEGELIEMDKSIIDRIDEFDVVFIGSPCHGGDLSGAAQEFIRSLPDNGRIRAAGFITHAGSVYSRSGYEKSFQTFNALCAGKGIENLGIFDCQGYLNPDIHDFVKKKDNLSDDEWARRVERMAGHPNREDLDGARQFAVSIIERC